MPLRRCACCGLPAAQETQCTTCEAPQKQHDETVEPMLYGEPLAVVVCALLEVGRGHTGRGQELVAAWRTGGSKALTAASFDALAQARCARMTGTHTQKKRPLLHVHRPALLTPDSSRASRSAQPARRSCTPTALRRRGSSKARTGTRRRATRCCTSASSSRPASTIPSRLGSEHALLAP